jgi:hypothetical protein
LFGNTLSATLNSIRPRADRRPSAARRSHGVATGGNSQTSTASSLHVGVRARRQTAAAIAALVEALTSPGERVSAACALLDHAYGQPVQHVALYAPEIVVECAARASANVEERPSARQTG